MQISDVIADMLTRIRNANDAKHATVDIPASNLKKSIAQILLDEGYIKNFQIVEDGKQGIIRVALKYTDGKQKVIHGLRRNEELDMLNTYHDNFGDPEDDPPAPEAPAQAPSADKT